MLLAFGLLLVRRAAQALHLLRLLLGRSLCLHGLFCIFWNGFLDETFLGSLLLLLFLFPSFLLLLRELELLGDLFYECSRRLRDREAWNTWKDDDALQVRKAFFDGESGVHFVEVLDE